MSLDRAYFRRAPQAAPADLDSSQFTGLQQHPHSGLTSTPPLLAQWLVTGASSGEPTWPRFAQDTQNSCVGAAVNRGYIWNPAPAAGRWFRLPQRLNMTIDCCDVWQVHAGEMLCLEGGGVAHLFDLV